jgi:hypothetical protein
MRKLLLLAVVLLGIVTPGFSAGLVYTRVLLPLYSENTVPGAFGSLWKTSFAVHNDTHGVFLIDWCSPIGPNSGCLADLLRDEQLLANETQLALPARYPKPTYAAAGTVIYVHGDPGALPEDLNGLSFELRIADISRSATNAGTEVPVVRETAFRTSTFRLLDVPFDARFRLAFRLFEMNVDRADFVVRVFDQDTNQLISERRVATSTPPQGSLRFQPGFVQITDLTSSSADATPSHVRVEVEPLTAGSAFWAYVSVTNNESQQLTLITPQ